MNESSVDSRQSPVAGKAGKRMLSVAEAAAEIGLAAKTLHNRILARRGPVCSRIGRKIIIDRRDLDRWVQIVSHRILPERH